MLNKSCSTNIKKFYREDKMENSKKLSLSRFGKSTLVKCLAVVVSLAFLYQDIVWAGGEELLANNHPPIPLTQIKETIKPQDLSLPYNIAQKSGAFTAAGDDNLIIHLQDAHASLSGQYSLAQALDNLVTNYNLNLIAIEGASGYIDTSILKTIPNKDVRKETADYLMREGKMGGAEFFSITSGKENVALYGIENEKLYWQNVTEFCAVDKEREKLVTITNGFITQLKTLEEKIYSPELKTFNDNSFAHKNKELSFSKYWENIQSLIKKLNIKTNEYTELSALIKTMEIEKQIDFSKANVERRSLIETLNPKLAKEDLKELIIKTAYLKEDKISKSEYHLYLAELAEKYNISLKEYKNLELFVEYINIYEKINIFMLYKEIFLIEEKIRAVIFTSNDEKELYEIMIMTWMLKRLYTVELTSDDFQIVKTWLSNYNATKFTSFIKETCAKYNAPILAEYNIKEMFAGLPSAIKFYETAEARNKNMIMNTVKHMNAEGARVAALVTGGFHSTGLTDLMEKEGLSYLVFAPKFKDNTPRPYIAVLTNKKSPYEKILDNGQYEIAVSAYCYTGNFEDFKEAIFYSLAVERLRGGDVRKMKTLWINQYAQEYTKLINNKTKLDTITTKPIKPEKFQSELENFMAVKKVEDGVLVMYKNKPVKLVTEKNGKISVNNTIPEKYINPAPLLVAAQKNSLSQKPLWEKALDKLNRTNQKLQETILTTLTLEETITEEMIINQLTKRINLPPDWQNYPALSLKVNNFIKEILVAKIEEIKKKNQSKHLSTPPSAQKETPTIANIDTEQDTPSPVAYLPEKPLSKLQTFWAWVKKQFSILKIGNRGAIDFGNDNNEFELIEQLIKTLLTGMEKQNINLILELIKTVLSTLPDNKKMPVDSIKALLGTKIAISLLKQKLINNKIKNMDKILNELLQILYSSTTDKKILFITELVDMFLLDAPIVLTESMIEKTIIQGVLDAAEIPNKTWLNKNWENYSYFSQRIIKNITKQVVTEWNKYSITVQTARIKNIFHWQTNMPEYLDHNTIVMEKVNDIFEPIKPLKEKLKNFFENIIKNHKGYFIPPALSMLLSISLIGMGILPLILGYNLNSLGIIFLVTGIIVGGFSIFPDIKRITQYGLTLNSFGNIFQALINNSAGILRITHPRNKNKTIEEIISLLNSNHATQLILKIVNDYKNSHYPKKAYVMRTFIKEYQMPNYWHESEKIVFLLNKIYATIISKWENENTSNNNSAPGSIDDVDEIINAIDPAENLVDVIENNAIEKTDDGGYSGGGGDGFDGGGDGFDGGGFDGGGGGSDGGFALTSLLTWLAPTIMFAVGIGPVILGNATTPQWILTILGGIWVAVNITLRVLSSAKNEPKQNEKNILTQPPIIPQLTIPIERRKNRLPIEATLDTPLGNLFRNELKLLTDILQKFSTVSIITQNMVLLELTKKISLPTDWQNDPQLKKQVNNFIAILIDAKNMIVTQENTLHTTPRVKISKKNNYPFSEKRNQQYSNPSPSPQLFSDKISYKNIDLIFPSLIILYTIPILTEEIVLSHLQKLISLPIDLKNNTEIQKEIYIFIEDIIKNRRVFTLKEFFYTQILQLERLERLLNDAARTKTQEIKNHKQKNTPDSSMGKITAWLKNIFSKSNDKGYVSLDNIKIITITIIFVIGFSLIITKQLSHFHWITLGLLLLSRGLKNIPVTIIPSISSSIAIFPLLFRQNHSLFDTVLWCIAFSLVGTLIAVLIGILLSDLFGTDDNKSSKKDKKYDDPGFGDGDGFDGGGFDGGGGGSDGGFALTSLLTWLAPTIMFAVGIGPVILGNATTPQWILTILGGIWGLINIALLFISPARINQLINNILFTQRKTSAQVTTSLIEPKIALGIPDTLYATLKNTIGINKFCARTGIQELIPLTSETPEEMFNELKNQVTRDTIYTIIDTDTLKEKAYSGEKFMYTAFEKVVSDFSEKTKKEIIILANPEITSLTGENIDKINNIQKLRKALNVWVYLLPEIISMEINSKSIFDMRVNYFHNKVFNEKYRLTNDAQNFISATLEKNNPIFMTLSAEQIADFKFYANAIRDMGLTKSQASQFIQIRVNDPNITKEKLPRYLEETGLNAYLDIDNVVLVNTDESIENVIGTARSTFGEHIDLNRLMIGDAKNLVTNDNDLAILKNKTSPRYVQMAGEGLKSQLLWALLEIAIKETAIPSAIGKVTIKDGHTNWYILIPNIDKIDMEKLKAEMENYEHIRIAA
ncbi:Glycine rich [Candidatus Omnitrophus magneticus]|uniref:Glycine rich n=1 Tax=Candidatus Omnitrophus magneticus TaxID=1609969 RepID=A0A0F0CPK5_9BACT|nr:Glycine rich [Candidatus Omnitrophus magneticus]